MLSLHVEDDPEPLPESHELLGRLPADMCPVAPDVLARLDDATRAR